MPWQHLVSVVSFGRFHMNCLSVTKTCENIPAVHLKQYLSSWHFSMVVVFFFVLYFWFVSFASGFFISGVFRFFRVVFFRIKHFLRGNVGKDSLTIMYQSMKNHISRGKWMVYKKRHSLCIEGVPLAQNICCMEVCNQHTRKCCKWWNQQTQNKMYAFINPIHENMWNPVHCKKASRNKMWLRK